MKTHNTDTSIKPSTELRDKYALLPIALVRNDPHPAGFSAYREHFRVLSN